MLPCLASLHFLCVAFSRTMPCAVSLAMNAEPTTRKALLEQGKEKLVANRYSFLLNKVHTHVLCVDDSAFGLDFKDLARVPALLDRRSLPHAYPGSCWQCVLCTYYFIMLQSPAVHSSALRALREQSWHRLVLCCMYTNETAHVLDNHVFFSWCLFLSPALSSSVSENDGTVIFFRISRVSSHVPRCHYRLHLTCASRNSS